MSFFSEINDLKNFAAGYNYFLYPAFNALCGGRHSRGLTAAAAARISSVIDKMTPDNAVSLLYDLRSGSKRIQIRRAAERMHKNVYTSIAPHTAEKLRQTIAEENLPEELVWEIKQILKNYAE